MDTEMDTEMDAPMESDRRASDQDTAIEQAFVAGVLPEEDRRAPVEAVPDFIPDVVPDVVEWVKRGDGTMVCFRNGQLSTDEAPV